MYLIKSPILCSVCFQISKYPLEGMLTSMYVYTWLTFKWASTLFPWNLMIPLFSMRIGQLNYTFVRWTSITSILAGFFFGWLQILIILAHKQIIFTYSILSSKPKGQRKIVLLHKSKLLSRFLFCFFKFILRFQSSQQIVSYSNVKFQINGRIFQIWQHKFAQWSYSVE